MKKVLIIANMLFASATVFGMQNCETNQHTGEFIFSCAKVDLFIKGLSKSGIVNYTEAKSNFLKDANHKFSDGNTLLIYAVCARQIDIASILIENYKVDLDIRNNEGDTALMQAIFNNNHEMAELLITNGADPNLEYQCGITALIQATLERNQEITNLLVGRSNIRANKKDSRGRTALMHAAYYNYGDIVDILLKGDVNINEQCKVGNTALIIASYLGHKAVTDRLLKCDKIDVNVENVEKNNALTAALYQGNEDIALDLLKRGADYTKQNSFGKTALWKAVEGKSPKVVEFIMLDIKQKRNKFINQKMNELILGFSYLAKNNKFGVLENRDIDEYIQDVNSADINSQGIRFHRSKLVKNSFNEYKKAITSLNTQDHKHKFTALMEAIYTGQKKVALLMLDEDNVQIYQKDMFGYTALWHAVSEGYETIIEELLKKYDRSMLIVEIDKPDSFGNILWNKVVSQGNNKIIRLFLEKLGEDKTKENQIETQKKESHKRVNVVVQKKMIEQPIAQEKPADRSKIVNQEFMNSVKKGKISDVEDFLREEDNNGDRIVRTDCINDALMIASENGNLGIVKLLKNHGADITYKDKEKNTPLILAAKNGQYHLIPTLLKYKENINAENIKNDSAIIVAATNAHVETVRMLLKRYDGVGKKVKDSHKKKALERVKEIKKRLEQELNRKKLKKSDDPRIRDYETIINLLSNKQTNQIANNQLVTNMKEKEIFWPIFFSNNSKKQMESLKKNDPITFDRMKKAIDQVSMDPFNMYDEMLESGFYVKKVGDDRLVYYVDGERVNIVSCKGHYEDNINKKSRKEVLRGILFSY